MSETIDKSVPLKYPIPIKNEDGTSEVRDKLWMGRLKLKHLKLLPPDVFNDGGAINVSKMVPAMPALIAGLANIPIEAAGEIDVEDLESLMEVLQTFFGSTQETDGEKSSG